MRSLDDGDATGVAQLHLHVFPESGLSGLGPRFLARFYSRFAGLPGHYGFVAHVDARLVGCVVAVGDGPAFWPAFARAEAWRLGPVLVSRALLEPEVRARLVHRLRPRPRTPAPAVPPTRARLLSIGLLEAERGRGIAERLVGELCTAMRRDGISHVGLSVRGENTRALGFYERTGWEREREVPGGFHLRRSTRT